VITGQVFDMRGKKFLDALVYTTPRTATGAIGVSPVRAGAPGSGGPGGAGGAGNSGLTAEESSSLLASSIFGFGFLGNNATGGGTNSPEPSSAQSPQVLQQQLSKGGAGSVGSDGKRSKRSGGKVGEILFVQSPALFTLVESRDDGTFLFHHYGFD
jgi:hypothetical protein